MAPELVKRTLTDLAKIDVWAVGVLLYKSLVGRYPYEQHNFDKSIDSILTTEMSSELKEVLRKIFVHDPSKRISLGKLVELKWFT